MGDAEPGDRSWIDEVADRFERAWRAGECPRIADFLAGAAGPRRDRLIEELVRVEKELRIAAGEMSRVDEYRQLFPDHAEAIAAFGTKEPPRASAGVGGAGRNLLLGLMALQNNFVDRDALLAAFATWVADKSRPLGRILLDRGALAADTHALLEALVEKHLAMHGDDPDRSLASLSSLGAARIGLEAIADPDLQASLCRVATDRTTDDPEATRAHASGRSSSAGPRFRVLRFHAKGGLGQVSVARDEELHRDVALKEIQDQYADDAGSRSRFVVEAEITGNLEHPGIIPVYGLGTYDDGRPFYAMRFIKGDNNTLKDAIERFHAGGSTGRDPGERALALQNLLRRFLDVCYAMAYAHSRGVLHRDLKPNNILLGPYGETLVVDWGLAKSVGREEKPAGEGEGEVTLRPESADASDATRAGSLIGTPAYMSPEQAAGHIDRLGAVSDVYSLGATLYCLLTGRSPFEDRDVDTVLEKVRRGDFPPPRAVVGAIQPALEAICLKAMALRPEGRYATPRALADDLEHWLAGEPVSVFRDPPATRLARWARRHPWAVRAAAVAALLLLLVPSVAYAWLREVAKREALVSKSLLDLQQAQAEQRSSLERQRALAGQVNNFRYHIAAYNDSRTVRLAHRPGATFQALARLRSAWHRYPVPGDPVNLRGEIIDCLGEAEVGNFRDPEGRIFFEHPIKALAISRDGKRVAIVEASLQVVDLVRTVQILGFDRHANRPDQSHFRPLCELRWGRLGPPDLRALWQARPRALPEAARALSSLLVAMTEVARELALSPDGRWAALGTSTGDIYLWDLDGPGPARPFIRWRAHDGGIHGLAFGHDSRSLFSAGDDKVLARWSLDGEPGARPAAGPRHEAGSRIGRLVLLDGGRRLFAARDGRLCEFDMNSLECRDAGLDLSKYRPDVLDLSPDGRFASVASEAGVEVIAREGGARLRRFVRAGQEEKEKDPAPVEVAALQFDPSGMLLLETRAGPSSRSRYIIVWEVATGREFWIRPAREGEPMVASFAPDGGHLFRTDHRAAHEQWGVLAYPIVPAGAREAVALTTRPAVAVVLAPDGATMACLSPARDERGNRQYEVTLWDAADGRLLRRRLFDGATWESSEHPRLAYGPGGSRLAILEPARVLLWDLADDGEVREIETGKVRPIHAFPRDGRLWGSIEDGNDAHLVRLALDRPGLQAVPFLAGDDRIPSGLTDARSFSSAGGGLVLVGTQRGTVEVFRDGETPARVTSWGGLLLDVPVTSIAMSPDGKLAAIGNRSGEIQVRRLPDGEVIGQSRDHAQAIRSLVFSRDGRKLASSGEDRNLRIWRMDGGDLRNPLVLPSLRPGQGNVAVGFSPDGRRIWTFGGTENVVRCWRLDRLDDLMRDLGGRLEEILRGEATPVDAQERLQLAALCYEKSLYAAAARFYEGAFAADPSLAGDRGTGHGYNAACFAALAGSGRGRDDPRPDEAARAALREKALGWLRAELTIWARVLDGGPEAGRKGAVSLEMVRWKNDADLAGIRDDAELNALPEGERQALRALWSEVEALSSKAAMKATTPPAR